MSKIENGGLDQYGARPFEQQQFGTAGVERVNIEQYVYNVRQIALDHLSQHITVTRSEWRTTLLNVLIHRLHVHCLSLSLVLAYYISANEPTSLSSYKLTQYDTTLPNL